MQNIFELSNSLANKVAEEVGTQHKQLEYEKAEAELQIDEIQTAADVSLRQIDEMTEAAIRLAKEHAQQLKKRVMEDAQARIQFQAHRRAQIEEQLQAFLPPEQRAA